MTDLPSPPEQAPAWPGVDRYGLVAACFLLSGFAALLYETVWLRQFAIVFGTSEQALSIVLGTYMGGLAIGSMVASKTAHKIRRPLLIYGLLELGIAIGALLVPLGLIAARRLQVVLFAGSDEPPAAGNLTQILFFFSAAFAVTIVPTGMMGATLPFLARHVVHRDEQLGKRIGTLYAINVLGAVFGTLAAAFLLLPALGLSRTVLMGVSVNVAVFLVVCLLFRSTPWQEDLDAAAAEEDVRAPEPNAGTAPAGTAPAGPPPATSRRSKRRRRDRQAQAAQPDRGAPQSLIRPAPASSDRSSWILPLIACSGAISFAYEILFTRMLGHLLGGSVFSFASMLASFLIGIAIGAGIASALAANKESSRLAFVYAQVGTALLALGSWYAIGSLATYVNAQALADQATHVPRALLAIIVLLPPAITIGMTFPLAIRIHARDQRDAASSSAKVYAWNTVGGLLGAFLTGTYLLPGTNYQLTLAVAVIGNILLALVVFSLSSVRPVHLVAPALAVIALVVAFPGQPEPLLRASPFPSKVYAGDLLFAKTGRSSTVTLYNVSGRFAFATNGLPEAGSVPKGWVMPSPVPVWLGALPCIVHPEAESMLVIGFGSGVAATSALDSVKQIDVFELEDGVIEANRLIHSDRIRDPLADRRINLIMNDGRSGLAMTRKKYDAIVSQPSHPWTAGASHLYTHEFVRLVKEHLNDQGVFVQWMDAAFADLDLFRSLGANLLDVFPYVQLYQPDRSTLLLVARNGVPPQPVPAVNDLSRRDRSLLYKLGIESPESLKPILSLDHPQMESLCSGAPLTTDDNNLMALRMRLLKADSPRQRDLFRRINQLDPYCDPERSAEIGSEDRAYVARRRLRMFRQANAEAIAAAAQDSSRRLTIEGDLKTLLGEHAEGAELLVGALRADPDNAIARCLLQFVLITHSTLLDESARELAFDQDLPAKFQAVIDAAEQLRTQRLDRMPELDIGLSRISPTSPLYPLAMQLRINWRLQDPAAGTPVSRGREALDLIDQAWPHGKFIELVPARVIAANLANRPLELIASAQMLAERLGPQKGDDQQDWQPVGLDAGARRLLIERCLAAMQRYEGDPRVPDHRYYGVQLLLNQTIQATAQP